MSETETLSPEQLAAIKARADAATDGPWSSWAANNRKDGVVDWYGVYFGDGKPDDETINIRGLPKRDANFIATSRTDIPALLAHIEAQAAEIERLRAERDEYKQAADAEAEIADGMVQYAERLRQALSFARSVIKSGEPWTPECERMIGGALAELKGGR